MVTFSWTLVKTIQTFNGVWWHQIWWHCILKTTQEPALIWLPDLSVYLFTFASATITKDHKLHNVNIIIYLTQTWSFKRQSPGQLWLIINFEMPWLKVFQNNSPSNLEIKEWMNFSTYIHSKKINSIHWKRILYCSVIFFSLSQLVITIPIIKGKAYGLIYKF